MVLILSTLLGLCCAFCGRNPKLRKKRDWWFLDLVQDTVQSRALVTLLFALCFLVAIQFALGNYWLKTTDRLLPRRVMDVRASTTGSMFAVHHGESLHDCRSGSSRPYVHVRNVYRQPLSKCECEAYVNDVHDYATHTRLPDTHVSLDKHVQQTEWSGFAHFGPMQVRYGNANSNTHQPVQVDIHIKCDCGEGYAGVHEMDHAEAYSHYAIFHIRLLPALMARSAGIGSAGQPVPVPQLSVGTITSPQAAVGVPLFSAPVFYTQDYIITSTVNVSSSTNVASDAAHRVVSAYLVPVDTTPLKSLTDMLKTLFQSVPSSPLRPDLLHYIATNVSRHVESLAGQASVLDHDRLKLFLTKSTNTTDDVAKAIAKFTGVQIGSADAQSFELGIIALFARVMSSNDGSDGVARTLLAELVVEFFAMWHGQHEIRYNGMPTDAYLHRILFMYNLLADPASKQNSRSYFDAPHLSGANMTNGLSATQCITDEHGLCTMSLQVEAAPAQGSYYLVYTVSNPLDTSVIPLNATVARPISTAFSDYFYIVNNVQAVDISYDLDVVYANEPVIVNTDVVPFIAPFIGRGDSVMARLPIVFAHRLDHPILPIKSLDGARGFLMPQSRCSLPPGGRSIEYGNPVCSFGHYSSGQYAVGGSVAGVSTRPALDQEWYLAVWRTDQIPDYAAFDAVNFISPLLSAMVIVLPLLLCAAPVPAGKSSDRSDGTSAYSHAERVHSRKASSRALYAMLFGGVILWRIIDAFANQNQTSVVFSAMLRVLTFGQLDASISATNSASHTAYPEGDGINNNIKGYTIDMTGIMVLVLTCMFVSHRQSHQEHIFQRIWRRLSRRPLRPAAAPRSMWFIRPSDNTLGAMSGTASSGRKSQHMNSLATAHRSDWNDALSSASDLSSDDSDYESDSESVLHPDYESDRPDSSDEKGRRGFQSGKDKDDDGDESVALTDYSVPLLDADAYSAATGSDSHSLEFGPSMHAKSYGNNIGIAKPHSTLLSDHQAAEVAQRGGLVPPFASTFLVQSFSASNVFTLVCMVTAIVVLLALLYEMVVQRLVHEFTWNPSFVENVNSVTISALTLIGCFYIAAWRWLSLLSGWTLVELFFPACCSKKLFRAVSAALGHSTDGMVSPSIIDTKHRRKQWRRVAMLFLYATFMELGPAIATLATQWHLLNKVAHNERGNATVHAIIALNLGMLPFYIGTIYGDRQSAKRPHHRSTYWQIVTGSCTLTGFVSISQVLASIAIVADTDESDANLMLSRSLCYVALVWLFASTRLMMYLSEYAPVARHSHVYALFGLYRWLRNQRALQVFFTAQFFLWFPAAVNTHYTVAVLLCCIFGSIATIHTALFVALRRTSMADVVNELARSLINYCAVTVPASCRRNWVGIRRCDPLPIVNTITGVVVFTFAVALSVGSPSNAPASVSIMLLVWISYSLLKSSPTTTAFQLYLFRNRGDCDIFIMWATLELKYRSHSDHSGSALHITKDGAGVSSSSQLSTSTSPGDGCKKNGEYMALPDVPDVKNSSIDYDRPAFRSPFAESFSVVYAAEQRRQERVQRMGICLRSIRALAESFPEYRRRRYAEYVEQGWRNRRERDAQPEWEPDPRVPNCLRAMAQRAKHALPAIYPTVLQDSPGFFYPLRLIIAVSLAFLVNIFACQCCFVFVDFMAFYYYDGLTQGLAAKARAESFFFPLTISTSVYAPLQLNWHGVLYQVTSMLTTAGYFTHGVHPEVYIRIAVFAIKICAGIACAIATYILYLVVVGYRSNMLALRRGEYFFDRNKYKATYASQLIGYTVALSGVGYAIALLFLIVIAVSGVVFYFWKAARFWLQTQTLALLQYTFSIILLVAAIRYAIDYTFSDPQARNLRIRFHRSYTFMDYFNVFIYLLAGYYVSIVRLALSPFVMLVNLCRVDRPMLPRNIEYLDFVYASYISTLLVDHHYNNPILLYYVQVLFADVRRQTIEFRKEAASDAEYNAQLRRRRARRRWYLAFFLISHGYHQRSPLNGSVYMDMKARKQRLHEYHSWQEVTSVSTVDVDVDVDGSNNLGGTYGTFEAKRNQ
jgi:Retinol binding protein receptor